MADSMNLKRYEYWLASFRDLFSLDSGFVRFCFEELSSYLQIFPIAGVDASHRTLAMICLEQMRRYRNFQQKQLQVVIKEDFLFLKYSLSNWHHHTHEASRVCVSLDFDMPEPALSSLRSSPVLVSGNESVHDRFAMLQIEDEWMYLEPE